MTSTHVHNVARLHIHNDAMPTNTPIPTDKREPNMFLTLVATDSNAAASFKQDWLRLRTQSNSTSPNTDPDRFLAVVNAMGSQVHPHCVLFRGTNGPHAMIIARSTRRRVGGKLGYLSWRSPMALRCLDVVYDGLLTDGTPEALSMINNYLKYNLEERAFDLVSINHLRTDSEIMASLSSHQNRIGRAQVGLSEPHVEFKLVPGSLEETLNQVSAKRRRQVRREHRLLSDHFDGDINLLEMRSESDIDKATQYAANISAGTYKAGIGVGFKDSPLWHSIMSSGAQAGTWRAWFLMAEGEPIAFMIGTILGNKCYLEHMGFLPEYARLSVGKATLVLVVEKLCADNIQAVDYGFGDASYKRVFGTHSWDEATLHLYAQGFRPAVAKRMQEFTNLLSHSGTKAAHTSGSTNTIKKLWRNHIRSTTLNSTNKPSSKAA